MKNQIIFIILACFAFNTNYAYISTPGPGAPKMYHNIPGSSEVTDEDIENEIRFILKSEFRPYEVGDVAFKVYNGIVTLTGTVESLSDKKKIEDRIKRIDAVNNIHNHLEVLKTTP